MLVLLAALEILARFPRFKNASAGAGFILALAAPLAVVAALCGWLLSLEGGYAENLLEWHERLGIGTAAGCVLAAILFQRGKIAAYRGILFITVALLMAAGHLGASLTHGSDYLTHYAPAPLKKLLGLPPEKKSSGQASGADLSKLPVFAGVIAPLFENKCVNCHGPDKSKGGLRLDSFAAVQKGGEDGSVITPGDTVQSPLLQRLQLPAGHDDHMPPAGKPQLTAGEIALLKWWVATGARETDSIADLQPPPGVLKILSTASRAE